MNRVDELNLLVTPFFKKLEKRLNKNTIVVKPQMDGIFHLPVITSLGGVQEIPQGENSFILNDLEAGMIKYVVKKNNDKVEFLARRAIGYVMADRMIEDPSIIEKQLKLLVTEMLLALEHKIGFKYTTLNAGTCYAKFERPGESGLYFTELKRLAAYEIRLYSNTWSCIDLNKDNK